MAEFFNSLQMVLQAAEMLEQSKYPKGNMSSSALLMTPSSLPSLRARRNVDDLAVPDISSPLLYSDKGRVARKSVSPFNYDDDSDGASSQDTDEQPSSKRSRMASSRVMNARNADTHNSVEKRRRAYLSSCYDNLKDSLPTMAGTRASNVKVLRGAAAYIKSLQSEDRRLMAEKQNLIQQQEALLRAREKRLQEHEFAVPCLAPNPPRRTSNDNDVAFTLMQLANASSF